MIEGVARTERDRPPSWDSTRGSPRHCLPHQDTKPLTIDPPPVQTVVASIGIESNLLEGDGYEPSIAEKLH